MYIMHSIFLVFVTPYSQNYLLSAELASRFAAWYNGGWQKIDVLQSGLWYCGCAIL